MPIVTPKILGLFELDTEGTVMYSKVNALNAPKVMPSDLFGLNFFEQVAPFGSNEEFRRRFRFFAKSSEWSEKFNVTCRFEDDSLNLNVMLTRISEREFDGARKLVIVDIRIGDSKNLGGE